MNSKQKALFWKLVEEINNDLIGFRELPDDLEPGQSVDYTEDAIDIIKKYIENYENT